MVSIVSIFRRVLLHSVKLVIQKSNFEIGDITQRQNEKAEQDHHENFLGRIFYLFPFHCLPGITRWIVFRPYPPRGCQQAVKRNQIAANQAIK
jgi:hypothetical protein